MKEVAQISDGSRLRNKKGREGGGEEGRSKKCFTLWQRYGAAAPRTSALVQKLGKGGQAGPQDTSSGSATANFLIFMRALLC